MDSAVGLASDGALRDQTEPAFDLIQPRGISWRIVHLKTRASMLALLKTGAGAASYASWLPVAEALGRSKSEKLESHLKMLYELLRDVTVLREGGTAIRNVDLRRSECAGRAGVAGGGLSER